MREMIHGAAAGGAVKFVGSRQAHMTTPITKSYGQSSSSQFSDAHIGGCTGRLTQTNSLTKTWPRFDPGAVYSAKIPAGP